MVSVHNTATKQHQLPDVVPTGSYALLIHFGFSVSSELSIKNDVLLDHRVGKAPNNR